MTSGRPVVTVDPAVNFGEPSVRGIAVDVIAAQVWAGEDLDQVADDYHLSRPEAILACWHVARHARRLWRLRWEAWLKTVESDLWHGRCDVVAPPNRNTEVAGG